MTDQLFRYAILSAVSSEPQARKEKGSLDDQEKFTRASMDAQGGRETAGPYRLDGYSRYGYVDLSVALKDIPPLAEAIRDLEQNQYDVLAMDNIERLGDLAQMLFTSFAQKKKQIHSVRQSGRIHDPQTYNPNDDESTSIMMHVEGIVQKYRISKIQRGLKIGIKKAVEGGRYSVRYPYGYKRINQEGDLEIDLPVAQLLIQLKDLFLSGMALRELTAHARKSGVPPQMGGEWGHSSISRILTNPFYTGKTYWGRYKTTRYIKRTANGKRSASMKLNPNPPTMYDGNHPALWTWDEHLRIMTEMNERYKLHPRRNPRNFSGLFVCTVCSHRLAYKEGRYVCSHGPIHVRITDAEANQLIGTRLAQALRDYTDTSTPLPGPDIAKDAEAAIDRQIAKVQKGFEVDIYTAQQAKEKINALRAQKEGIATRKEDAEYRQRARERLIAQREALLPKLNKLPVILERNDPKANNRMMRDILQAIYISPEHELEFDFR